MSGKTAEALVFVLAYLVCVIWMIAWCIGNWWKSRKAAKLRAVNGFSCSATEKNGGQA